MTSSVNNRRQQQCNDNDTTRGGGLPSLGVALLFATFGFGTDRFYVGQFGLGTILLVSYVVVIGLIIALPIQILTQISLMIAIFSGKQTAFMYGEGVVFAPPTLFDKTIAVIWLISYLLGITCLYVVLSST